ncbi:hypothetical protein GGTG_03095 [Gaeumannomyces tritici R3-111a-1]|uniref:Uncharacterized protein n=1 Tax=Gaeumannomyces tritici (strain R3-111a-1) TaxID=644352 RepID=J3NP89_GAET3|nr:hypothetical protein GGTG_03095 [Gaeumannomyces tritici R3-111a-1]EJT77992.1 hypothetical protein GGTG_03095 [Gaeumannomyces tritici R3-111a-1]
MKTARAAQNLVCPTIMRQLWSYFEVLPCACIEAKATDSWLFCRDAGRPLVQPANADRRKAEEKDRKIPQFIIGVLASKNSQRYPSSVLCAPRFAWWTLCK